MKKKLYRVNGSEEFNWDSMYTHLWVQRHEAEERKDWKTWDEINDLMEKMDDVGHVYIGRLVPWETLKFIREIQRERQEIRYCTCLAAGMDERDAALAFTD